MRLQLRLCILIVLSVSGCGNIFNKNADYQEITCTLSWERLADCKGEIGKENGDASIESVAFSPNGKIVASVSQKGSDIILWNAETGESIWETNMDFPLKAVQFIPDNDYLIVGGESRYLKLLNTKSGKLIKNLDGKANIECINISDNNEFIAAGNEAGKIIIWRIADFEIVKEIQHDVSNEKKDINDVRFSEKDKYLISGGYNSVINYYNIKNDFSKVKSIKKVNGSVKSIRISPNGKYLASSTTAKNIDNASANALFVWDMKTGDNIYTQYFDFGIEAVEFSPNGQFLLAGGTEGKDIKGPFAGYGNIYVYKINEKPDEPYLELVNKIKAFRAEYLQFNKEGDRLLTAHEDGSIKMWNVEYIK